MALGRIGGGVLKDNLERNGSNLNFKNTSGSTAILHLDVVNSRVGINTESPAATYSLDVPTPLVSTNLISDNANVQNWTLDTNRIYQNSGDINLSGSSNVFLSGLLTDNLRVNFNTFRSLADSNINLTPNGTGTVEIYSRELFELRQGAFIQDAVKSLQVEEREQLISGTHGKCWTDMFGEDE